MTSSAPSPSTPAAPAAPAPAENSSPSKVSPAKADGTTNIDDFDLPRTVINRIAKTCFPEGTALAKETRLAMTKSATVFIHYITATAHDLCKSQNKKTISVDHIYKALEMNEFEGVLDYVRQMVSIHKEVAKQKRQDYRMKKTASSQPTVGEGEEEEEDDDVSSSAAPVVIPSKRGLKEQQQQEGEPSSSPRKNSSETKMMDVDSEDVDKDNRTKKLKGDEQDLESAQSSNSSPSKSISALVNPVTSDDGEEA